MDGSSERVVVYSKPGCHLCADAVVVVEAVCTELGVGWAERDISSDADLMRTYGEQIPVIFVDCKQHDCWRVSPDRLRTALRTDPR